MASSAPLWWDAPPAGGVISTRVTVPGSKSLTNRALFLAALAQEPTIIHGALRARDTELMAAALTQLGVDISGWSDPGAPLRVTVPRQLGNPNPLTPIHCGLAGTVMRFIPALAATAVGKFEFRADPQAGLRPLRPLLEALRDLGGNISWPPTNAGAVFPFQVCGSGSLPGDTVTIDASASSQFLSALLLIGPRCAAGLDVRLAGQAPSAPHIAMTVAALRQRGVRVHELTDSGHPLAPGITARRWRVEAGPLRGGDVKIEPDLSNAGPFLAAAAICGGQVRIGPWPRQTTQAGDAWRQILPAFGLTVAQEGEDLVVSHPGWRHQPLRGVSLDLANVSELSPTVAALAALASQQGQSSSLRGLGHIRGHETDRLAALEAELRRLGCQAHAGPDHLEIAPSTLHPADLQSYHDHRMATFGAIIGLGIPGVRVENIATTSKTLPEFASQWTHLVASTQESAS